MWKNYINTTESKCDGKKVKMVKNDINILKFQIFKK